MAAHLHCHPHNNLAATTINTSCGCCCRCSTPCHHPLPSDPHLYSIPSLSHHFQCPPQTHLYSPSLSSPYDLNNYQTQYHPPQPNLQKQPRFHHHHYQQYQENNHATVSALLRRIAVLESSIHRHSSASYSLRDAAARTIQTHFRAFLVRRSRTLRQLKDLASIKSTVNALKSSLFHNAHFDNQVLSRKAMGLLLKLDSIQGVDPMIRDGKRSIGKELITLIGFADGESVKATEISSRAVKNAIISGNGNKCKVSYGDYGSADANRLYVGGDRKELMNKLRGQVEGLSMVSEDSSEESEELERPGISINGKDVICRNKSGGVVKKHGGIQAKLKKSVSFAENGNVYRVFRSSPEPVLNGDGNLNDGSDSLDGERVLLHDICGEVEEIGILSKDAEEEEEVRLEDGGSSRIRDGERDPRRHQSAEGKDEQWRQSENEEESSVFYAPLPVKMEARADLANKRKTSKVLS